MAKTYGRNREIDQPTPVATWLLRLGFASLAMIILLFTPFTNNLDDIKVTLQYWIGPTLVFLYLYLYTQGFVRPIPKIPFYCIIGYMAVMVVSIALCQYPWLGFSQFGFQFSLVGFFLVLAGTIVNRKNLHDAVWFFVLMGFATTFFGMFHYFGGFKFLLNEMVTTRNQNAPLSQLIYTLARTNDMLSTILNRDFFASFLVFLFPLAISAFIVSENIKSRIFIAVTGIMMFFCFYLGLSKDSMGAFSVSMVTYVLLYWKFCRYKKLNIPYWWVWGLGIALWLGTTIYMTWGFFRGILLNIDTSLNSRSIIWGGGIGIWLDGPKNFLVGGGPGHFRVLFPLHRAPDYFMHQISNVTLFAHNRYIDLLAEEGIIGFTIYMILIAAIFYYSFIVLVKCKDGDQRVYQLGVLSGLLGLLLANIFSPNVRWTVVAVNFWAMMGLGIGNYELWKWGELEQPKRRLRQHQAIKPAFIALMAICGVFTLWNWYYGYVYFKGSYHNNEGIKLMQPVEQYPNLPPQQKREYLLRAIDHFNTATNYNPTFLTSYYKVAHCYNQLAALSMNNQEENLKYQKQSLETYRLLQKYAKDYAEIHYNLGIVNGIIYNLTREEQYQKDSLVEFIEAARQSNKIIVQYKLAEAYMDSKQPEKSIEVLKRIQTLPINPDPDDGPRDQFYKDRAPYFILELHTRAKEYDKAEAQAIEIFESKPGDDVVINHLFRIYDEMGDLARSESFLRRLLEINPANIKARAKLATVLEKSGKNDQAIEELKMALFFQKEAPDIQSQLNMLLNKQNS